MLSQIYNTCNNYLVDVATDEPSVTTTQSVSMTTASTGPTGAITPTVPTTTATIGPTGATTTASTGAITDGPTSASTTQTVSTTETPGRYRNSNSYEIKAMVVCMYLQWESSQ